MLFAHTLNADQIKLFLNVIVKIRKLDSIPEEDGQRQEGNGPLDREYRRQFRVYAKSRGAIDPQNKSFANNLHELLRGKEGSLPQSHTPFVALTCDFLIFRFESAVLDRAILPENDKRDLLRKISLLRKSVQARIDGLNNPFNFLASRIKPKDLVETVPTYYLQKFVGYRRSSHYGDVIRFTFNIHRQGNVVSNFVRYENEYMRHETEYRVGGAGMFADNTLYLFGQARRGNGASHGYRVQALRPIDLEKPLVLCGPVLSRDGVGPIAARIVLVPWKKHNWTKAQEELLAEGQEDLLKQDNRRLSEEEKESIAIEKLKKYIIKPPGEFEKSKYIEEVKYNVSHLFGGLSEEGLFYYMSNLTTTVVQGVPLAGDEAIKDETKIRAHLHLQREEILDAGGEENPVSYRDAFEAFLKRWSSNIGPSY